ncbi:hypothetical protein LOZ65_006929 [Ophidiomyces ophidiicola]|nr:hypothetical protein LOZ65_006929 [Ophidiomyces ophidiicola]
MKDENLGLDTNFAPSGTFVDIHINQNRHALSQSIGTSRRIWLLYPPTESNLRVFVGSSGESGRLTKISGQLEGGYIIQASSSEIIYLPPAWLHATFTVCSGVLVGVNFVSLEILATMSHSLCVRFPYFFRLPHDFEEDFRVHQEAIENFLGSEHDQGIVESVIQSWIQLAGAFRCKDPNPDLAGEAMARWRAEFHQIWKYTLSEKAASCCRQNVGDMYRHILEEHMW